MWERRVKLLLGKDFEPNKTIKENLSHLPKHMQEDLDIRQFLWKFSLYLRGEDKLRYHSDLQKLWKILSRRYNIQPDFFKEKP